MLRLTDDQVRQMIDSADVPEEVRAASPLVAVVLTQSWCPDWSYLQSIVGQAATDDLTVFYSEYDREPFFRDLMRFKEDVFGNRLIPYVRYYRDGSFVSDGNVVSSAKRFLERFTA